MLSIRGLKSQAIRRLTLLVLWALVLASLGALAPMQAHAAGEMQSLYGYAVAGMPTKSENYMPIAVVSVVLTALGLCMFGLALRRRGSH